MSDEVEKYEEFGDLSFPEGRDEDSSLDEYGVWIKKKPSADDTDTLQSSEEKEVVMEEEETPFDFDGLNENDSSYEDAFEKEMKEIEDVSGEASSDSNFDDIDMSNFFTDLGNQEEDAETLKKEDEEALKMDLNFETLDSYTNDEKKDDFDSMLDDVESSDDELDDFLSDLNSSTSSSTTPSISDDVSKENIELSINVDENQDFSNIGGTSETEESVILPHPASESSESNVEEKDEPSVVIKNTVVEPENIDEIREENRKVMGEDQKKEFSDIEALANELTSDISNVTDNLYAKEGGVVSVQGLDKITDLLTDIVKELSSMKTEIATLKTSSNFVSADENTQKDKDVDKDETTGFFKDEDTDEAIALTGDELNNILITADFTEENEKTDNKTSEQEIGSCEACSGDEVENDFSSEQNVDFDDITLENSKLDDFVIPEELDYSMLNHEDEETASAGETDMSYLEEKDSEDDVSVDIPETQDIAVKENTSVSSSETTELPSNIKEEIKSVLVYMDQLLESLPEDKMKEFAESEYFETYNRLFSELGIS